MNVQTVSLRRWRLRTFARVRIAIWVPLLALWGALAVFLGADSSSVAARIAWIAAGIVAVTAAIWSLIPLVAARTPGHLSVTDAGIEVTSPAFLRGELHIPWSDIERISASPIGPGAVFDGGLVAPTVVLVLRPDARAPSPVRWRWTVLVAVVGVRSRDRWPPPSRFLDQERIAFNLDCDQSTADRLLSQWEADLARHTEQRPQVSERQGTGDPE